MHPRHDKRSSYGGLQGTSAGNRRHRAAGRRDRAAPARISPEGVAAEERRGQAVADLARESGIEHLVYSSLNGASARSGIPYYESKARIEEHIHALGLPATILRPVSFMDNSPPTIARFCTTASSWSTSPCSQSFRCR